MVTVSAEAYHAKPPQNFKNSVWILAWFKNQSIIEFRKNIPTG